MKAISSAKIREGGMIEVDNQILLKLYSLYQKELYLYLYSFCGDRHLAEDAVQETLLATVTRIGQFRGESSLYSWMYSIMLRWCRRQQRRRLIDSSLILLPRRGENSWPRLRLRKHRRFREGPQA